jgi:hypothetical protein
MNDDPVDLSPLDPTRGPRFDQIVRRIRDEAAPLLAARRNRFDLISEVGKWRRQVLVAATIVVVLAGITTATSRPQEVASLQETDFLGVPGRWGQWATGDKPPQPSSIVDFFVELQ